MDQLGHLESFVRSAETGSFAEAARQLGLTPAAVGKNVARLELRTGVRLFQRSTRRLTLTEAGQLLLGQVSTNLRGIQHALNNLATLEGEASGTLKVSMGHAFGQLYVLPLLGEFLRLYPRISPDWHFDNRQIDLIGQGFDAAIGGGFDLPLGVVARRLAPAHRVLVASPVWLAQAPAVNTPGDLAEVKGILIRSPQTGRVRAWPLTHRSGAVSAMPLPASMTMTDSAAACLAAEQGLGVALVSLPFALPGLSAGRLARVLPDWYVEDGNISLYYREHKLLPAKTRAFTTFLLERFEQLEISKRFSAI